MRLIDADELKTLSYEVLVDTDNPNRADGLSVYNGLVEDDIDLAPTVEAIPIEWIEKWCKCLRENINNVSYKNLNVYQEVYEDYLKMERLLSMMIEDWRKENETD